MSIFSRLRAWWSKDDLETADEETRMTPAERDVAEEDYEARKIDTEIQSGRLAGGQADYERDSESEPPR
jgi:hypothetical protein